MSRDGKQPKSSPPATVPVDQRETSAELDGYREKLIECELLRADLVCRMAEAAGLDKRREIDEFKKSIGGLPVALPGGGGSRSDKHSKLIGFGAQLAECELREKMLVQRISEMEERLQGQTPSK